jgi:hypothetical protein
MPIDLISKIAPKNSGLFPMVEDVHLEGGFQVRTDIPDRDSIPPLNRKIGTTVFVISDNTTYRLSGGITNGDWVAVQATETSGYKDPARVATVGDVNIAALNAPDPVDGVSLAPGDRVLVHDQTLPAENGIYTVVIPGTGADGTWIRSSDANTVDKLIPGSEIYVVEGNTHSSCKFWLVTPGPYTLGVTPLEFTGGLSVMKSDGVPTTILASTAIGLGVGAAIATNSISVRGFNEVDFSYLVANLGTGPIIELRGRVYYSLLASPGSYGASPEDWNLLLAEDISGGVSTVDPYTISLDASAYPDFTPLPGSFAIRAPASGQHMMMIIWSEIGDPTSSNFTGSALRRV